METTPKGLSDVLRAAIARDTRTDYRLAKDAGVAPITIGRFMRKERDLRLATAEKIAAALGLVLRDGSESEL